MSLIVHLDTRKPTWQATVPLERPAEKQELAGQRSVRLAIRVKNRILLVDSGDVIAVIAQGNYVVLQRTETSHRLRESISVVAEQLAPCGFIQIHRSVLVNSSMVEEVQQWRTGEWGLRMKDGSEYTVTRTYKKSLNALADLWIGTSGLLNPRRA